MIERPFIKKYFLGITIFVYIFSYFINSFLFSDLFSVKAEDSVQHTDIVAIFVEEDLYSSIQGDLDWYATTYLQQYALTNTKAIILPVDTSNFESKDLVKVLENIYFDGIAEESSSLVGVLLFGEIPLPVINDNGFIYPSIYPYVDFENQKFIWDPDDKFFVPNNIANGQAEVWHSIINFDNISDYSDFFGKLENYKKNPSKFVDKKIWYEDFVANKKYFNEETLPYYINNFLFAEDIAYHRYTDLMMQILQGAQVENLEELISTFSDDPYIQGATTATSPTYTLQKTIFEGFIKPYSSLFSEKYLNDIQSNLEVSNRWVDSFTGLDNKRRESPSVDTHFLMTDQADESLLRNNMPLDGLLLDLNGSMENALNQKVEEEKYYVNLPLPLTYLNYEGNYKTVSLLKKACIWDKYEAYENYYFGRKASTISSLEDTNIYRGTYRNLDSLGDITIQDIQSSENPSTDLSSLDLSKKSIGASYDIFSTQVSSNRAYNMFNVKEEVDIYTENKIADQDKWKMGCTKYLFGWDWLGICIGDTIFTAKNDECNLDDEEEQEGCEDTTEFAMRNWGGASPLNITGESFDQWAEPFEYTGAVRSIFDVGGSQATLKNHDSALDQNSINEYTNLIQVRFGGGISSNVTNLAPDLPGIGYRSDVASSLLFPNELPLIDDNVFKKDVINWVSTEPKSFSSVDYFDIFNETSQKSREGDIIKLADRQAGLCYGKGEVYTYKTIDSRVYHNNIRPNWIGGSVYKVFEDEQSPSKVFADGIENSLNLLSNKISVVEAVLTSIDTDGPGYYMDELDTIISDANAEISSVADFDVSVLESYSGGSISSLANDWNGVIDGSIVLEVESLVEETIQSLSEIQGFFEMFSFNSLISFIKDEIYASEINGYDIFIFSQSLITWFDQLDGFVSKLQEIPSLLVGLRSQYNEIGKIQTNSEVFSQKKSDIDSLQMCGEPAVTQCGCSEDYSSLCGALDTLIANLSNHGVATNNQLNKIISYEETVVDEDGNSLGDVMQYPIQDVLDAAGDSSKKLDDEKSEINDLISTFEQSSNSGFTVKSEGINLVTKDRPIDSPRYITFQGVGGDTVKLIYPDLYKVEVFKEQDGSLVLKNPQEIELALVSYLQDVVKKYNEYLLDQNNKKDSFYGSDSSAFDLLGQLDALANPNSSRSLDLLDENFFVDLLENQISDSDFLSNELGIYSPLEFVANALYKHNVGWNNKTHETTIKDSLQSVYSDFDINQKIKNTLETYLKQENDQGEILSPQYSQDGYEVGYFNSDGMDYIVIDDLDTSIVESLNSSTKNFSDDVTDSSKNNPSSDFVDEIGEECGINMDEPQLLFDISDMTSPWAKAFACWRDQTKEKPLELKFSWDSSVGQVLTNGYGSGNENIKSEEMDLGDLFSQIVDDGGYNIDQTIQERKNSWEAYGKQWEALDIEDDNQKALESLEGVDQQRLSDFVSYVQFKLADATLSPEDDSTILSISSAKNLGNMSLKLSNVGDNCFVFNSKKICEGSMAFDYNPYDSTSSLGVKLDTANVIAGYNVLTLQYCIGEMCAKKIQRINVVPGQLDTTNVRFVKDSIYAGASIPFEVEGTDVYGNNVGQQINRKFVIKVSAGSLSKGYNYNKKEIIFDDFSKDIFVYNAPKDFDGNAKVYLYERLLDEDVLLAQKEITITNVIPHLTYSHDGRNDSTQDGKIIIDLPEEKTEYKYLDENNVSQIKKENLPHITLKLKKNDGSILDSLFSVVLKSQKGLLNFGEVKTRNVKNDKQQVYFDQQLNFAGDQYIDIYFYPTFKAGEDVVTIKIQGLDPIEIPIEINPASPKKVSLSLEQDSLSLNSVVNGYAQIFDRWNNRLDEDLGINLGAMGKVELLNSPTFDGMKYNFSIKSKDAGGIGYIFSTIKGVGVDEQQSDTKKIVVQDIFLPEDGLNVMYLNLFGSDWGNQWGYFSDNDGYVENLFSKSDKLLAATTQLVSPDKLKKFLLLLNNDGSLSSLKDEDITLSFGLDTFIYSTPSVGDVYQKYNGLDFVQINDVDEIVDGTNGLYYIPEQLDSVVTGNVVKDNKLYINGVVFLDLTKAYKDSTLKISSWKGADGLGTWILSYNGKKLGKFFIRLSDFEWTTLDLEAGLYSSSVWSQGSTNSDNSLGIFQSDSEYAVNNLGYTSIQDSLDTTAGVGFRGDFKNITHFANGLSVGESTKDFSSEFLINIGDPLLKRISDNESLKIYDKEGVEVSDTFFDGSIGGKIYSDTSFNIQKPYVVDFNNDGLDDILLSLSNSQLKILKNNGGGKPFTDLGLLIFVADGIKEIYFGDVDGDNYQDILVVSKKNKLRIYKNDKGVIQVDGNPVCINTNVKDGISENPDDLSQINQIFFEDMDNDGKTDIITNDALGFVKIFFGGNDSYVSKLSTTCDNERYDRQSGKEKILDRFAIEINKNDKVLDSSLIRWSGLGLDDDANYDDTNPEDLGLEGIDGLEGNDDVGAVLDIISQYSQTKSLDTFMQKYPNLVSDPVGVVPSYETDDSQAGSISYMPISYLNEAMPIDVYKKYKDINGGVLENGDVVEISVYINAKESFVGTFVDQIQGPWKILTREDGSIKTFWFDENTISLDTIENQLGLYWNIPNGYYMMDNIRLSAGKQLKFNYQVEYMGGAVSPITIQIDDIDGDLYKLPYSKNDYLDVKIKPGDSCMRAMNVFFNKGSRSFTKQYVDLQKIVDDYLEDKNKEQKSNSKQLNEEIESSLSGMDISSLMGDDTMELRKNVGLLSSNEELQSILEIDYEGTADAALDSLGKLFGKDILESANQACQGFSLPDGGGNCKGLPVPFNQAFLAPGTYHLFGCYELKFLDNIIGGGVPMLFFPSTLTLPLPIGPIPSLGPWAGPQKMDPADGFDIWPGGGVYPSMFRMYLAPTLTAQLGIGICFGPYSVGANIPSPISDVVGNCLVFAVAPQCGNSEVNRNDVSGGDPEPTPTIDGPFADLGTCNMSNIPPKAQQNGYSPSFASLVQGQVGSQKPFVLSSSNAFDFVVLDVQPVYEQYSPVEDTNTFAGVDIEGGISSQNKILGPNSNGIIDKIMRGWLDKQVKYILNNVTNMSLNIYLPEVEDLFQGFDKISERETAYEQDKCDKMKGTWNFDLGVCENKKVEDSSAFDGLKDNLQDILMSGNLDKYSESNFVNPFDKWAALFEEVPLIRMRTENINVQIPLLTAREIDSYTQYLKEWVERNKDIMSQWEALFSKLFNACGDRKVDSYSDMAGAYAEIVDKLKEETLASPTDLVAAGQLSIAKSQAFNSLLSSQGNKNLGDVDIYQGCDDTTMYIKSYDTSSYESILTQGSFQQYNIQDGSITSLSSMPDCLGNKLHSSLSESCVDAFMSQGFANALSSFLNINSNVEKTIFAIKENIEILELYKKFPMELYEWVHVQDRYIQELTSLVQSFLGTISLWMEVNSTRLSQYVDAIILIIATIKTYQVIIDFSTEWSESCGSCSQDNYDSYTCKLSFLCQGLELPILPIPPFKLPNINIDLSHINLGLDIKLPKFNFQPLKVDLPTLPDIPTPPNFDFNLNMNVINIPDVPVLPKPPVLQPLPSFLPEIKMQLPVLPPAPKIPEIPNEITEIIKVAKGISKILCIVKKGIGFVGEKSLKARIEQMTQRTYEVPFWDTQDLTPKWLQNTFETAGNLSNSKFSETPQFGFDYQIDSYVNLQYNFAGVYSLFDELARGLNSFSNDLAGDVNLASSSVSKFSSDLSVGLQECINNPSKESCMKNSVLANSFKNLADSMSKIGEQSEDLESLFVQTKKVVSQKTSLEDKLEKLNLEKQNIVDTIDFAQKNLLLDKATDNKAYIEQQNYTIETNQKLLVDIDLEIVDLQQEINQLNTIYTQQQSIYQDKVEEYNLESEKYTSLKKDILDKSMEPVNQSQEVLNQLDTEYEKTQKTVESLQDQMEFMKDQNVMETQSSASQDEISFVDYDFDVSKDSKQNLLKILDDVDQDALSSDLKNKVKDLVDYIDYSPKTSKSSLDEELEKSTQLVFQEYKETNSQLAYVINDDYENFLERVENSDIQLVAGKDIDMNISLPLLSLDEKTKAILSDNPLQEYLSYQEGEVNSYLESLEKNIPDDLNMTENTYQKTKNLLSDVKNKINTLQYSYLDGGEKPNIKNIQLAQSATQTSTSSPDLDMDNVDLGSYVNGVFVKVQDDQIINVVKSEEYAKKLEDNHYFVDLNQDGNEDILLRDNNNVYIKYYDQNSSYKAEKHFSKSYVYNLNSLQDLQKDQNDGYVSIRDIKLKLYDENREIKNFAVKGQSFDSLTLSWKNSKLLGDNPDAYLLKLSHRVDYFTDKESTDVSSAWANKKYVLALPKGIETGENIQLEETKGSVDKLIDDYIYEVSEYDSVQDKISVQITKAPRSWQYAKVMTLKLVGDTYYINSPDSNQVVAGMQIIADDQGPLADVSLYRPSIGKTISEGSNLKGYVGTDYILRTKWLDNVELSFVQIQDEEGNVLVEKQGIQSANQDLNIEGLFFDYPQTIRYILYGEDIEGNAYDDIITLVIKNPDINITEINRLFPDSKVSPVSVIAELSNDIDKGYVSFNKYHQGNLETLSASKDGNTQSYFPVSPGDPVIVGEYFDMGSMVGFYDQQGHVVATLDSTNGQVALSAGYEDNYSVIVSFNKKVPTINIIEKATGEIRFTLALPTDSLVDIQPGIWSQIPLSGEEWGEFDGGYVLTKNGVAMIYVALDGTIYTDQTIYGDYEYDTINKTIKYYFRDILIGDNVGYIEVKATSFLEE